MFFGVPHSATFIFVIFLYVIASIAYIHPVYSAGVRTHDLLIMSRLPYPLDHGSRLTTLNFFKISFSKKIVSFVFSDDEPFQEGHLRGPARGGRQRHRGQSLRSRSEQKPNLRFSGFPRTASAANLSARRQLQSARNRSSVDRARDQPAIPQPVEQQVKAAAGRAEPDVAAARALHLLQQVRVDSELRLQHCKAGDTCCGNQSGKQNCPKKIFAVFFLLNYWTTILIVSFKD
jgi:hypothetical protein